MNVVEILIKKKNRTALSTGEIRYLVDGYVSGSVPDYQMAAFLMAVFFNGMTFSETTDLTMAMRDSGTVFSFPHIEGFKADKHSTGGVGDKVSLVLAPLAAACGLYVPMISGRGLGHTGGTLDKLESIPGFRVALTPDEFEEVLTKTGAVLAGQSNDLVPADRKMYALRDVTATVDSIPLISASIMSKKLAEGINGLVLDIKVGRGAFMKNRNDAEALADYLLKIGKNAGLEICAVLTDMNQPIGNTIGNWLETREAIEVLSGKGPADLRELTVKLVAQMLRLGGLVENDQSGEALAANKLDSGAAYERFIRIVREQGGDVSVVEHPEKYPQTPYFQDLIATETGFVEDVDSYALGMLSVVLGAGRRVVADTIAPAAGIALHKKSGDAVEKGERLMTAYTHIEGLATEVKTRGEKAFRIGPKRPPGRPLVLGIMR